MQHVPRNVISYLVLPRPGDLVKWLIFPVGFLLGVITRGVASKDAVVEAVVIWICLELLVYQARYQWNDIRGFEADQAHPDGDRGRLPGPVELKRSRLVWSASTAGLKIVIAVTACRLVSPRAGATMVAVTLGVFALAAVYELLRGVSTGRTGQVPPPVTPGIAAIWVVVGAGYALRTVAGVSIATRMDSGLFLGVVGTSWLFGVAWVTSRWAVESTAYARLDDDRLVWAATSGDAKEHQLALVRWLPQAPYEGGDLRLWTAVRSGTRWSAPWNVTGVVAGGCAAASGVLLVEPATPPAKWLVGSALGLMLSAVLLFSGRRREVVTAMAGPVMVGLMVLAGIQEPWLAVLPWLTVSTAQACYLRQDRASMGRFLRPPWRVFRRHSSSVTSSAA